MIEMGAHPGRGSRYHRLGPPPDGVGFSGFRNPNPIRGRPHRQELPGFASNPASYLAVKWIPPKWDWVDPLKDRKAEIEAIEAGLKSRSDVIESEGFDAEEVDRRIAADHTREEELGLEFGRSATAQAAPAVELETEDRERPNQSEEQAA